MTRGGGRAGTAATRHTPGPRPGPCKRSVTAGCGRAKGSRILPVSLVERTMPLRRAILAETGLPSVLNTDSPEAARIYEGLGFREIGQYPQWRPGPVKRTDPDAERT